MVFLLGRMGDNKRALNLIIERLGDVQRVRRELSHLARGMRLLTLLYGQAIEFAKEQNDNDLWEDLLKYSETKPRELNLALRVDTRCSLIHSFP